MGKYCVNCGIQLKDEEKFCHSCGAQQPEKEQNIDMNHAASIYQNTTSEISYQSTSSDTEYADSSRDVIYQGNTAGTGYNYSSVNNNPIIAEKTDETTSVVKISTFFLLDLLYAVPGIGFIACIVIAVVAKNKNISNHAIARLIWALIGAIITIIISALIIAGFSKIAQYLPY